MASRRLLALVTSAALCATTAACDDDSSGGGVSEPSQITPVTFRTTDTANDRVKIDGPARIDAGVVALTLVNDSIDPHDAQILRVEGNRTARQVISHSIDAEAGAPIPAWITDGAGLGTVFQGDEATAIQVLEPGTYYLLDSERATGENVMNARNGGVAKFEVTGKGTGELPGGDATITADDYSFEVDGIEPGNNRVLFENAGAQLHHMIALPYAKGATSADVERFFTASGEPDREPPVDLENGVGTAVIDGGQEQIVELDFDAGRYALLCFITDRSGGPPHVAMGMVGELNVE